MDHVQLKAIIAHGQKRMEEKEIKYDIFGLEFSLSDQIAQGVNLILWAKELIDAGVQASPEASMAWCGISFILPLLARSAETEEVHRDGFVHVTARMQFYVQLEPLLF